MKRKTFPFLAACCLIHISISTAAVGQTTVAQDSGAGPKDSSAIAANVPAPMSDSAKAAYLQNASLGRALFLGDARLVNGGPSCISCHNVKSADLPEGGLLAKDLTHVFGRLGAAGLPPILASTPFPAMASAYKAKPISPEEVAQLTAFFQQVEETSVPGEPAKSYNTLMIGGGIGLVLWMGLIFGLYRNRKTASVKQAIYQRQIH